MQKWMPIRGNFIEKDESIIFQGVAKQSPNNDIPSILANLQTAPDGIVIYEDMISNGSIETTVEFEEFNEGDFAQIVFNYQSDFNYMSSGVVNQPAKYVFNLVNGQESTINYSGLIGNLPITHFDIKLQLFGSFLELYINDIKVLTSSIPYFVNSTQVGVWIKSKGNVTIKNFKAEPKKPEAFIVSQFGGDYDILCDEVIKPVCNKLNYKPTRGDEMPGCSVILNDIITSIYNSAVIIVDITPNNPNVFYELGYAHALRKPTILLCEKGARERLPFDVSGFRTIFYDNSIGGKRKVEEKLEEYLQNIVNPIVV